MSNPQKYGSGHSGHLRGVGVGGSMSDDHTETSQSSLNNNRQSYEESKETFRILREMSDILNCGLRSEALGHCIRLVEDGADPAKLAELIKKWRTRADPAKQQASTSKVSFSANGSG